MSQTERNTQPRTFFFDATEGDKRHVFMTETSILRYRVCSSDGELMGEIAYRWQALVYHVLDSTEWRSATTLCEAVRALWEAHTATKEHQESRLMDLTTTRN